MTVFSVSSLDVPWRSSLFSIHFLAPWAPQSPLVFPVVPFARKWITNSGTWLESYVFLHHSVFLDKQSLFPNTAVGSSENWLVCGHRGVSCRLEDHASSWAQHTQKMSKSLWLYGPFCSCKNPVYKTLWRLHKREQQGEMAWKSNPPCSRFLGKASQGEPSLNQ